MEAGGLGLGWLDTDTDSDSDRAGAPWAAETERPGRARAAADEGADSDPDLVSGVLGTRASWLRLHSHSLPGWLYRRAREDVAAETAAEDAAEAAQLQHAAAATAGTGAERSVTAAAAHAAMCALLEAQERAAKSLGAVEAHLAEEIAADEI